ncbi:hypothetical protein SAMN05877753_103236 [Bacillus oleivorans]|uniref:Uncharacterized protein n=1 Tax=Bacillus oleivorans TaxID=1448271 RepID=A0A285CQL0_9BACI|nr:hypothetical protein [Bacillus oleivorans]SNX69801.1 hypothetical protein SAMN05877753_103236 [Bacillus oleivorans]
MRKQKNVILKNVITLFIVVLISIGCTPPEKDSTTVANLILEEYNYKLEPYQDKIQFTLATNEILNGVNESFKTKIYDTEFYFKEVKERTNDIMIIFGFNNQFNDTGKMLIPFRINAANNTWMGTVKREAFNESGEPGDFGSGASGNTSVLENTFEGQIYYFIEPDELMNGEQWTFVISGLNTLSYNKK